MKLLSGIAVLGLVVAGTAVPSFADVIAPSGVDSSITTTNANFTGSVALATANSQTFNDGTDHFYGGLSVITNYSGNPYGLGDVTFVYEMGVYPGNSGHAESISMGNFSGYDVDIEEGTNDGNTGASFATLDSTGETLKFYYIGNNELMPGDETYLLIVNTNAPSYTSGTFTIQDDTTWTSTNSYGPAATPEPSTLSLLGTGLLAAGAGLRRRMRRS
jgi:hypothetical protein